MTEGGGAGSAALGVTADWYRSFARVETPMHSAIYEKWAGGVAGDDQIIELLDTLPLQKRQPNLIFAAARLLGAPSFGDYDTFREFALNNWAAIAAEAVVRSTQTNEARRCASLLPALSKVSGAISLLEVGASAGLCLYPDRYSYRYDGGARLDPSDGPSTVLLECTTTGPMAVPTMLPEVAWRAGLDLNPLDVHDDRDIHWLETLVWPEQHERRERLKAAVEIVRADAPRIVKGDAIDDLAALSETAPDDTTLVIVTSAVLVYLPLEARIRFAAEVEKLRVHRSVRWISLEGLRGLPVVRAALPFDGGSNDRFVLALDQKPLAFTGPHGHHLDWFD